MSKAKISRSRRRGYHAEVELVEGIRRAGGEALRVAGSGHKTKADVLASVPGVGKKRLFAFEVKATEKCRVRVPTGRVRELLEFCHGFKQGEHEPIPALAVKWIGQGGKWTCERVLGDSGITLGFTGGRARGLLEEISKIGRS